MKTPSIFILVAMTAIMSSMSTFGQSPLPSEEALSRTLPKAPTPEFDKFVGRLESCTGMLRKLNEWSKVLKPTIRELGYSEQEIGLTKKALRNSTVTIQDAELFSQKWLAVHGERLDAVKILQFLLRGKGANDSSQIAAD
jgi:hypothetical protein